MAAFTGAASLLLSASRTPWAVSSRGPDGTALPTPPSHPDLNRRLICVRGSFPRARTCMERLMYRLAGVVSAVLILMGSAFSPASAEDKALTVFAAASMKNALDDIDAAFTA